jgi:hypothetical protein
MTVTVNISPGRDTDIHQHEATGNHGSFTGLRVGESTAGTGWLSRSLIWFDILTHVPAGSTIQSATLHLHMDVEASDNARTMDIFRVIRPWVEMEATWNIARTGVNWGTAGCGSTTTDFVNTVLGSRSFSATEAVGWKPIAFVAAGITDLQNIVNGSVVYEGYILRMRTELNDRYQFSSREHSTVAQRPYLEITFIPPGGEFQVIIIG